jgi:hypothetical protein
MARSFNGTSDTMQNTTNPLASGAFTYALWCFLNGTTGTRIFGSGNITFGIIQYFSFNADGNTNLFAFAPARGINPQAVANATSSTGSWFHLAATYVTTPLTTLYVNGVAQTTTSATAADFSGDRMTIGSNPPLNGAWFNGLSADATIWTTNLSATEVAALANGVRPNAIRPSSLVRWWALDGRQSPEPDLSGNAQNMTLTGTSLGFGPPYMMFSPRRSPVPAPSPPQVVVSYQRAQQILMTGP